MIRRQHAVASVTVPARLHLGFLDLEGGLGRKYGSLGITLDKPVTRVRLAAAALNAAQGPDCERAARYLARVTEHFGLEGAHDLTVEAAIPAHGGLGSGTQMALAVGCAVTRLHGVAAAPTDLAQLLDRGTRSGIGLGAFLQGGVLLDGGRGIAETPPPIIARFPFPADWRVLLITDQSRPGLHGAQEIAAFEGLPPFPAEAAARLCRLALMVALPALAEGDAVRFGAAVSELQRVVGDHFAPAQGGRFASPGVTDVLEWLAHEGVAGYGQSSWGPTGFALFATESSARSYLEAAQRRWPETCGLRFSLHQGRNSGAEVALEEAVGAV